MVCMDQISHAQVTVPPAFVIGHNYQKNHVTVSYLKYTEFKISKKERSVLANV